MQHLLGLQDIPQPQFHGHWNVLRLIFLQIYRMVQNTVAPLNPMKHPNDIRPGSLHRGQEPSSFDVLLEAVRLDMTSQSA